MLLVKKYPNRRLYDTRNSRYMTLEDLEKIIRSGEDIAVQDAQDGRDLTQEVLTQIILERGKGKILPAALLMRLIRLDDAALGEFLTRYVSWALDMYMQMKQRTTSILPRQIASAPFAAADALARMMLDASPYARYQRPQAPPMPPLSVPEEPPPPPFEDLAPPMPEPAETNVSLQVQQLRSEIEALRASIDSGSVALPGGTSARIAPKKKAKAVKKRRS
jgi:polyhydroxyalkanoate synthesis repressor PhaR